MGFFQKHREAKEARRIQKRIEKTRQARLEDRRQQEAAAAEKSAAASTPAPAQAMGSCEARFRQAQALETGSEQDRAQAFALYESIHPLYLSIQFREEDQDVWVRPAMMRCGEMLFTGDGVPQDRAKAYDFFQKLATSQETFSGGLFLDNFPAAYPEGMFFLGKACLCCGVMCLKGDGVPQDRARAMDFLADAYDFLYKSAYHGYSQAAVLREQNQAFFDLLDED